MPRRTFVSTPRFCALVDFAEGARFAHLRDSGWLPCANRAVGAGLCPRVGRFARLALACVNMWVGKTWQNLPDVFVCLTGDCPDNRHRCRGPSCLSRNETLAVGFDECERRRLEVCQDTESPSRRTTVNGPTCNTWSDVGCQCV
jgi:hypothetical protein